MVPGAYDLPARRHHARRGLHEHDADRRLPRRRPARGDAPDRAARRRARRRARPRRRPRCGGATSPPSSRTPRPPASRTTRATTRKALDKALEMADYAGFEARRSEAAARGNYRGIGLSTWVEICGLAPSAVTKAIGIGAGGWESSIVRLHPTGSVTVITGSSAHGQGHETSLVADRRERARHPVRPGRGRPRRHGPVPLRPRHLRLALAGGRRHGAAADVRQGARQGAPDRRAPARVLGRRPRVGGRPVAGQGLARARQVDPGAGLRGLGRRLDARPASSRTSRRRRSTTRPTSRSRSARTSPRSRSTARRARSRSSATRRSTTAAT